MGRSPPQDKITYRTCNVYFHVFSYILIYIFVYFALLYCILMFFSCISVYFHTFFKYFPEDFEYIERRTESRKDSRGTLVELCLANEVKVINMMYRKQSNKLAIHGKSKKETWKYSVQFGCIFSLFLSFHWGGSAPPPDPHNKSASGLPNKHGSINMLLVTC